ncbi:hypothetical protein ILP86_04670 [Microbacterium sp. R1]|uniref:Capsid maturation protease n=1 Tax=Microbacterium phage vB_MoxS-R1 TaxID=2848881 RepID=A0A8F2E4K9_9CAUD|nr:hypothetical protein [Microbacterium sp. R1]YP_010649927.1 head maturation protease [Microbacterium phage vB_MoxS-R1]MBE7953612.1 hypothetical protein [Microbacterium sp. R1]QWT28897.1 capsid maturation protease [Microbacterium phage vB_MoxS-R1]
MVTQRSYQQAVEQVRNRLLVASNRLWSNLGSYRDSDIDRLVALVVPHVQAGQIHIANLTEAYFQAVGARAGIDVRYVTGGRGVPAEEVYRRPAATVYSALADDKPMALAVEEGATRLASLISTDMQMAKVRQAQRSLESAGITAFVRVLTGNENCALCVIASTQRYLTSELSPIHPGCDCSVDRLPPGFDPDRQIVNSDLLELTHATIEQKLGATDRGARDLGLGKTIRDTPISDYTDLIVTRTHGEYGPTLAWRDEKFTSKAQIEALQ